MAEQSVKKYKKFHKSKNNVQHIIQNRKKKKQSEIDSEINSLTSKYNEVKSEDLQCFPDFPLSEKTQKGLQAGKFTKPTDIQKQSLLLSLQGNDILGAAKTGSGKTLAFLVPVLEKLYREKWSQVDGLGALIISPTRELAFQTFEVLKIIGKFHDFSAGLVIGGKHVREEAERINRTNIVICTPGRLLQHMDQTINFHADNLQVLVLDEADRILDLGFQESMNAIIENLPAERQTLLFSATQTKSVKDLARLSLKNPMYISVHENAKHSTPTQLQQSLIVCELHEKLDVLWSFIRNHLKKKILVFLSSCKQVRFVYEVFRKLRPGVTVLSLHGAMQQMKRVATYESFCRKQSAVLFATDIAARGLDFPAVHWVIQLDCPEDASTYIHRVGRTARYEQDGEALLVLVPSEEEAMLKQLTDKKIPVDRIRVNPKKMGSIQRKLESLCASEVQMKEFAKRAFVSYLKSVYFMKNKTVFNIKLLDTDKFASSLGLAIPPRIRFLQKELNRQKEKQKESDNTAALNKFTKTKDSEGEESSESEVNSESGEESDTEGIVKDSNNVFTVSKSKKSGEKALNEDNVKSDSSETDSSENESSENESNEETLTSDNKEKTAAPGRKLSKKLLTKENTGSEDFTPFSLGNVEDDSDLLMVKKKSVQMEESSEEEELETKTPQKQGKKRLTKAAIAKKIMKKNLKVNTKVIFDDEGQEVRDVLKKSTISSSEEEDNDGGISIAQAKKRMEQEDRVDREIYRERIKQKHKEKRIKEKEKRRAEAERRKQQNLEEEVAVLGSADQGQSDGSFNSEDADSDHHSDYTGDSDGSELVSDQAMDSSEEESGSEDAGFETNESSENDEIEESDNEGNDLTNRRSRKRKVQETFQNSKRKKHQEDFTTGLSLLDDEQIALNLLQQR